MSQQINLFNPIFLKQKKVFTARPMLEALVVLVLGALALVFYGLQSVAALQGELAATGKQLAQRKARQASAVLQFVPRQKSAELAQQLAAAELELASLHKVAAVLQRGEIGNTAGYADYFRALARQSVGGLWLTGVSIVGAGNEIAVQGRALQAALVPAYIGRLGHEPVLRGKSFASLQIAQATQAPKEGGATTAAAGAAAAPYVEFSLHTVAGAQRP
ncbi:MAG: PilN domain-containing protein [Massilia sp.]|nr:PilN domain-containing protein [Massilia sp.]